VREAASVNSYSASIYAAGHTAESNVFQHTNSYLWHSLRFPSDRLAQFLTEDMPKLLSESLKRARARVSRIRDSIGSSKIDEAPGLFAETSAEDRSAMSTILNGSTESLGTVAPAIVVSESQQGDPIPGSQSRTSLHLQEPDTFASDLFPSTNDSSARSGAPSGASQIKVNQVQVSIHFMLQ
jgi:hypothetical protein